MQIRNPGKALDDEKHGQLKIRINSCQNHTIGHTFVIQSNLVFSDNRTRLAVFGTTSVKIERLVLER